MPKRSERDLIDDWLNKNPTKMALNGVLMKLIKKAGLITFLLKGPGHDFK